MLMVLDAIEFGLSVIGAGCFVCAICVILYSVVVELRERKREPGWTDADMDALWQKQVARQINEHFSRMEAE